MRIRRRTFLAGTAALASGVFVNMRWIEPRWLRVTNVPVKLPGPVASATAPKNRVRILHLSDLHFSEQVPLHYLRRAVELGLASKPDVVCLTGDLITHRIPNVDGYRAVLRLLARQCPTFACVGNHDGGAWAARHGGYTDLQPMFRLLEAAEIQVLFNTARAVPVGDTSILLVGLGDYWSQDALPEQAFKSEFSDESSPRIVLSHNPDSKQLLEAYHWDLMLCGHTHGGQLSLPIIGTPFAPVRDHAYVYGLNAWRGRWIYTTSGVGNLHGMRLHCRPEVAVLDVI